jgi:hypothetical protein
VLYPSHLPLATNLVSLAVLLSATGPAYLPKLDRRKPLQELFTGLLRGKFLVCHELPVASELLASPRGTFEDD